MAQLAWLYFQHTQDKDFLRDLAYPLLSGAFETYWTMLEESEDGSLHLPVSVSPEFKGCCNDAWGRCKFSAQRMSFLAQVLPQAAATLEEAIDDRWQGGLCRLFHWSLPTHQRSS